VVSIEQKTNLLGVPARYWAWFRRESVACSLIAFRAVARWPRGRLSSISGRRSKSFLKQEQLYLLSSARERGSSLEGMGDGKGGGTSRYHKRAYVAKGNLRSAERRPSSFCTEVRRVFPVKVRTQPVRAQLNLKAFEPQVASLKKKKKDEEGGTI